MLHLVYALHCWPCNLSRDTLQELWVSGLFVKDYSELAAIVAVLTVIATLTAETRLRREPPINVGLFAQCIQPIVWLTQNATKKCEPFISFMTVTRFCKIIVQIISLWEKSIDDEIMYEFCSLQCANGSCWCDYYKCSRQVASNARRSSAKRSFLSLTHKIVDFLKFSLGNWRK